MLININDKISFVPLLHWTHRGVCKVEQINMVLKHEIYRVEIPVTKSLYNELRLRRPMHILWYIGHC